MSNAAKFGAGAAEQWTETAYADPGTYLDHRAELIVSLGPRLVAGDRVLDLACGDAGLGEFLLRRGLRYLGVDASAAMVDAAQKRLGTSAEIQLGTVDVYRPEEPVAATTLFRALYYARDRPAFFRRVADYTQKKLVFDLNPRQYGVEQIRNELEGAGFGSLQLRPFFVPQTVSLARPLARALIAAERVRPLAAVLLRFRFTYVCVASRASTR